MPMRYADQKTVLADLKIRDTDPIAIESVVKVENGLAAIFDGMVGYRFGEEPVAETRLVEGRGTDLLGLGYPGARQVTTVAVGGWWDGTGWQDEQVLQPNDWMWGGTVPNYFTIRRLGAIWAGPVRVTAIWADQPVPGEIPDDVRGALTIATVKEYRRHTSSPQDVVGPDGMTIPTPSGLNDPQFKVAVSKYRLRRQRAGV